MATLTPEILEMLRPIWRDALEAEQRLAIYDQEARERMQKLLAEPSPKPIRFHPETHS